MSTETGLSKEALKEIGQALGRIPSSLYILSSRHQQRKRGVLVSWVQQVSFEPPMVMVSLQKGRSIIPLMHDSHYFALCQISREDKLAIKKFASANQDENQFEGLETIPKTAMGSPVLASAISYVECELVRHIDFEADHDLYVGMVVDGKVLRPDHESPVHFRKDGFKY